MVGFRNPEGERRRGLIIDKAKRADTFDGRIVYIYVRSKVRLRLTFLAPRGPTTLRIALQGVRSQREHKIGKSFWLTLGMFHIMSFYWGL